MDIDNIRENNSIALQNYLEVEIRRVDTSEPLAPSDFLEILLSSKLCPYKDRDYLDRIAQVAYERHIARRVDQDVPTLVIAPKLLTKQQADELLDVRFNYVTIFGAESVYFQDTVHALAVDSYYPGTANVLGVHIEWLSSTFGSIKRALVVDRTGQVKEVAFHEPVPIHIAHILHLPREREQQLHRELSDRFRQQHIPQINPYTGGAERADDKAWTHALWEQCDQEIASPKYILIPQNSSPEEIVTKLRSFLKGINDRNIVVQPNKGTEGYKVERFYVESDSEYALSPVVGYINDSILGEDDAIVRERRGNVRYRDQLSGSFVNVTLRVNVAWNGSEFVAESGYAQIAKDEKTFTASRGREGAIIDINEALSNLCFLSSERWTRFIPAREDIDAIKAASIIAAQALNAGLDADACLKFMGIDILLEVNALNIIPVVLEVNPRPAGLSHSSEIIGISEGNAQHRISTELFRFPYPIEN